MRVRGGCGAPAVAPRLLNIPRDGCVAQNREVRVPEVRENSLAKHAIPAGRVIRCGAGCVRYVHMGGLALVSGVGDAGFGVGVGGRGRRALA